MVSETTIPTTTTEVLYGPPWVFYKTGDATMDDKIDARDLTVIKRAALLGREASYDTSVPSVNLTNYGIADVNHDDVVDKEDVKQFMEQQLGIPPKEEESVTTTTVTQNPDDDDIISSLETTTATTVMLLYGPPPMRE